MTVPQPSMAGCRRLRAVQVSCMEVLDDTGVQDIPGRNPELFLWTVTLATSSQVDIQQPLDREHWTACNKTRAVEAEQEDSMEKRHSLLTETWTHPEDSMEKRHSLLTETWNTGLTRRLFGRVTLSPILKGPMKYGESFPEVVLTGRSLVDNHFLCPGQKLGAGRCLRLVYLR